MQGRRFIGTFSVAIEELTTIGHEKWCLGCPACNGDGLSASSIVLVMCSAPQFEKNHAGLVSADVLTLAVANVIE